MGNFFFVGFGRRFSELLSLLKLFLICLNFFNVRWIYLMFLWKCFFLLLKFWLIVGYFFGLLLEVMFSNKCLLFNILMFVVVFVICVVWCWGKINEVIFNVMFLLVMDNVLR